MDNALTIDPQDEQALAPVTAEMIKEVQNEIPGVLVDGSSSPGLSVVWRLGLRIAAAVLSVPSLANWLTSLLLARLHANVSPPAAAPPAQ